jgi:hypothetical protein
MSALDQADKKWGACCGVYSQKHVFLFFATGECAPNPVSLLDSDVVTSSGQPEEEIHFPGVKCIGN